ncbi:hypothetical protein ABK040_002828 [Willaertia magna]
MGSELSKTSSTELIFEIPNTNPATTIEQEENTQELYLQTIFNIKDINFLTDTYATTSQTTRKTINKRKSLKQQQELYQPTNAQQVS